MINSFDCQLSYHALALILSIILSPISHLLLRLGARNRSTMGKTLLNIYTISGNSLFALVVVFAIYAMQQFDMKTVMAWSSIVYILTPLSAQFFLKEKFSLRMITGALFIILGITIFFW